MDDAIAQCALDLANRADHRINRDFRSRAKRGASNTLRPDINELFDAVALVLTRSYDLQPLSIVITLGRHAGDIDGSPLAVRAMVFVYGTLRWLIFQLTRT